MTNQLTLKMVESLKELLTEKEFIELCNLLVQYKIFSRGELNSIGEYTTIIHDIDELVGYLAVKEELYMDGLKAMIPAIGIWNFHYLIARLFEYNKIDLETYKNYLIEFNLLKDENQIKK